MMRTTQELDLTGTVTTLAMPSSLTAALFLLLPVAFWAVLRLRFAARHR